MFEKLLGSLKWAFNGELKSDTRVWILLYKVGGLIVFQAKD